MFVLLFSQSRWLLLLPLLPTLLLLLKLAMIKTEHLAFTLFGGNRRDSSFQLGPGIGGQQQRRWWWQWWQQHSALAGTSASGVTAGVMFISDV